MDKRSLLFIFAITFSFFFVSQWFSPTPTENISQEIAHNVEENQVIAKKIAFNEVSPVSLYSDSEGNNLVSYAAKVGDSYLALAWDLELPEKLYVFENSLAKSVQLSHKNTHLKEPVVYSAKGKPLIEVPNFLFAKRKDLQFVDFSKEPQSARTVHGLFQDGKLIFSEMPALTDSIVLIESEAGYSPIGVFDANAQKVRPLQDFLKLQSIVLVKNEVVDMTDHLDETRYVLENEYQQLVFSSRGGALAEINLPFHSDNNRLSVVKSVGADKQINKFSPRNDYFPLFEHYGPSERGLGHSVHKIGKKGGYYPLIRRSLLNDEGRVVADISPKYYAFNILSNDGDTANLLYKMTKYEENTIVFEASQPHRRIKKTYRLPSVNNGGPYCFELDIEIEGDKRGLWLSSGVPEAELVAGSFQPNFRIQLNKGSKVAIEELSLPKEENVSTTTIPDWISNSNGFFGILTDGTSQMGPGYKTEQVSGKEVPTRLTLIDPQYHLYPAHKYPGYISFVPLEGSPNKITFRVYAGPYEEKILNLVDKVYSNPVTGYKTNYASAQSIQGWFSFISEPFAQFLYFIMKLFHSVTGSWGLSIILLTIVLKLMLYPLNNWSIRSSLKMQAVAPQVKALQERYKKDPRKAQMEVMNLYREKGVNPFTGCFPMLIQMPFLFGMFYLLKSSFSLRGASFIPGWIPDLSAPDVLFSWNYPVFFIGTQFHLLPILLGVTMFLQQKMTSKLPADPSQLTDQQKQQKMMGNIMAIVFTLIFYSFPSGLNLYFLSSNLLGILQQWYVNNTMNKSPMKTSPKKL